MQALRVAHLAHYVDRKRAHRLEYRRGQYVAVARDHAHGYGLAYRAAHAHDYRGDYAAPRGRYQHAEHRFLMGRAQRRRALIVAGGQRAQRVFAYRDNRGQYHQRQHYRRGQHAVAVARAVFGYEGHDYHHAEEAVDYRGYARQQLYALAQQRLQPLGAELGHVYGRQQAHRHAQQQRAARYVQAADYHVEYSELLRVVIGLPGRTGKEVPKPHLAYRRPRALEYEHAYAGHRRQRRERREQKHYPRCPFPEQRPARSRAYIVRHSIFTSRLPYCSFLRAYCILSSFVH